VSFLCMHLISLSFLFLHSIGIVLGLLICSILMGVIASAVNTTIVLFADAPAEFEKHYPELSNEMREAYSAAHPGSI
jgi:hypothetical protein